MKPMFTCQKHNFQSSTVTYCWRCDDENAHPFDLKYVYKFLSTIPNVVAGYKKLAPNVKGSWLYPLPNGQEVRLVLFASRHTPLKKNGKRTTQRLFVWFGRGDLTAFGRVRFGGLPGQSRGGRVLFPTV